MDLFLVWIQIELVYLFLKRLICQNNNNRVIITSEKSRELLSRLSLEFSRLLWQNVLALFLFLVFHHYMFNWILKSHWNAINMTLKITIWAYNQIISSFSLLPSNPRIYFLFLSNLCLLSSLVAVTYMQNYWEFPC